VGAELVRRSIEVARAEKLGKMIATILADNKEMQSLCKKLGFQITPLGDRYVRAELAL
jgi:RimJ/RimL family protein N-acetyltransferase